MNIAFQQELRLPISTIYGPADYRDFRSQLEQIDNLLIHTKVEDHLISTALDPKTKMNPKRIKFLHTAIRVQVLLHLTGMSARELAFHLADSELFRWFIGVNTLLGDKSPSKSTINRMERIYNVAAIEEVIHKVNKSVSSSDSEKIELLLHDDTPFTITDIFADSTCIKANIHYPVDWVLFRDAERTLLKGIKLIRNQGLLHRMPEPDTLIKEINKLSIEMTNASRNRNGKKIRKRIFRKMKQHLKMVERHATRYICILEKNIKLTKWSEKQTQVVIDRMENVQKQISSIITVAHARIISEKKVENAAKIPSLYEKDVHIIKRGKMNADIEFGNGLYLAEQQDGVLVDWQFFRNYPSTDSAIVKDSINRIKQNYGINLYASDRGFNTKKNDDFLKEEKIFNATCPKNPQTLSLKLKDNKFCKAQKRRAQTEGRIGIFKNKFIGEKIHRKCFVNRELKIVWSILTHNLWVIARKAQANYKEKLEESKKAA
jgi:hypothetical protein